MTKKTLLILTLSFLMMAAYTTSVVLAQEYYVSIRVEPIIPTDLGDRVVEPATVYVDAPGATSLEVYLQPVDAPFYGNPIGEPQLIGIDNDPSGSFSMKWNADDPYLYVELYAVAYGQPDVNYSRTSDPITILLDWRHLGEGPEE
jgi:hypothetical protein